VHNHSTAFTDLEPGVPLPPLRLTISAAANERYWRAAGAAHPALASGALYPPIAANLTILAFQQTCPEPMIQTRQRLTCRRAAPAGQELVVTGAITAAYEKRGRRYVDVRATIATAEDSAPLWTSDVTFTPVATLEAPGRSSAP
jgi:hypothetical protein